MCIVIIDGADFIGSNFVLYWLAQCDESGVNLEKLTYAGNPEHERSLLWCPALGVQLPLDGEPKLAAKGAAGKCLSEADVFE